MAGGERNTQGELLKALVYLVEIESQSPCVSVLLLL